MLRRPLVSESDGALEPPYTCRGNQGNPDWEGGWRSAQGPTSKAREKKKRGGEMAGWSVG